MKRKLLLLVGLVSIMLMVFSSTCFAIPKDEKATKPVTLKFVFWGSPYEKKIVEESNRAFSKKYNWITIESSQIPYGDFATKMATMVAGNDSPDVSYVYALQAFDWAKQDKFYNIYDLMKNDNEVKKEDFLPNIWAEWEPGKAFGSLISMEPIGLIYNVDLFKSAGVPLPPANAEKAWTWEQFVDVAKKLTIDQNGKNAADPAFNPKRIKQFGVAFPVWTTGYMPFVWENGGDYLSPDGKKIALTDPAATEAIQKLADLINVYHVAPTPAQAKSMPSYAVALQSKQIAMVFEGNWALLDLTASKVNFGVGVLPKLKRSATIYGFDCNAIFKSTKHLDEAWLYWKWSTDPESTLSFHADGLWMPLKKDWYTDKNKLARWAIGNPAHPEGFVDAFVNQVLKNGIPCLSLTVKNFGEIDSIVYPALDRVWLGEQTADSALKNAEAAINKRVQGRYIFSK